MKPCTDYFPVVCAARQFLTQFATKRTTARNGVAFGDADNVRMSVIQERMDASNSVPGGCINLRAHSGKRKI